MSGSLKVIRQKMLRRKSFMVGREVALFDAWPQARFLDETASPETGR